jgi:peptidoglycan/LPS O-acetylase OafA/YrhL
MSKSDTRRFALVEELRGLAAMAVVLYHANEGKHITHLMEYVPSWARWPIENGHLGVAIFFVLSGFVIAHSLTNRHLSYPFVGRFLLRRYLRLAPPYWFAISLALLFAFASAHFVEGKEPPVISLRQIAAHLFYLQEILEYKEINPIFWTLCQEVQFYATFALLLAVSGINPYSRTLNQRTIGIFAPVALVSLLWPLGLVVAEPWRGSFFPLWFSFLLGVGAHWSWKHPELAPYCLMYAAIILAFGVLRQDALAVTCALTSLALFYGAARGLIYCGLGLSSLQMLGTVSYSLYLTHNPITGAVFRLGTMLTGRSAIAEFLWWPIAILACVAFATAVWWLIERPSMILAKRV